MMMKPQNVKKWAMPGSGSRKTPRWPSTISTKYLMRSPRLSKRFSGRPSSMSRTSWRMRTANAAHAAMSTAAKTTAPNSPPAGQMVGWPITKLLCQAWHSRPARRGGTRSGSAPLRALALLDGGRQLRHDHIQVAGDGQIAEAEDRRVFVLVDGDDETGGAHSRPLLHPPRECAPRG